MKSFAIFLIFLSSLGSNAAIMFHHIHNTEGHFYESPRFDSEITVGELKERLRKMEAKRNGNSIGAILINDAPLTASDETKIKELGWPGSVAENDDIFYSTSIVMFLKPIQMKSARNVVQ